MTTQPPITSHEVIHDYSLLERFREKNQPTTVSPAPSPKGIVLAAILLAALALAIAVCTLIYVYVSPLPGLVPGSFSDATVVVDAKGRVVSVTQGVPPTTVMVAPSAPTGGPPEVPWVNSSSTQSMDVPKTAPPWSKPPSIPPSPPKETMPSETAPPVVPESEPAKIVEDFVKFQSVNFKGGVVQTGWRYADSNASEPEYQWCYYRSLNRSAKGLQPTLDLESEADLDAIRAVGLTEDEHIEAQSKCQWFNNMKPVPERAPGKTY